MAEGLAEFLPRSTCKGIGRDEHGHITISQSTLHDVFEDLIAKEYTAQTGKKREDHRRCNSATKSRCAKPHAFDVMLGSQLGVGAYRALVEKRLNGVMVSVSGQLQLHYVPFEELVDPETLVTVVRYIETDSDFHRLTRFLEMYVNEEELTRRQIAAHRSRSRVERPLARRRESRHSDASVQRALRARHAGHARVGFDGHPQAPGGRFEDRFADVVAVAAVVHEDVQVAQRVGGEGLPEFFDQFAVEVADLGRREIGAEDADREPAAQIDRHRGQRLFHRQREVAVAADAGLVAQRLLERLAEADADVFDRVVLVDVQVALGANREVDRGVLGQQRQHVVEKADAGGDIGLARAIQVERELNVRFRLFCGRWWRCESWQITQGENCGCYRHRSTARMTAASADGAERTAKTQIARQRVLPGRNLRYNRMTRAGVIYRRSPTPNPGPFRGGCVRRIRPTGRR